MGKSLGVPCTVVLPSTTPKDVHARLRLFGAEVVVHGGVWDEADVRARQIVEEGKGGYVHPFDQPSTVFERCKSLGPARVQSFITTDVAAIRACMRLASEHRVLVEPACGVRKDIWIFAGQQTHSA